MCGIAGIINKGGEPIEESLISTMTDSLESRGPDERGVYLKKNIGIGHRRLTIIDTTGGQQPFKDNDLNILLSYNGEIYNYLELRSELKAKGHSFVSNSDTEVLLKSYIEWGENCVNHLRGMFAFSILDNEREKLFLARDHFGIKPLYYLSTNNTFAFSSELQALRHIPNIDWIVNTQALDQYLNLHYIAAPLTIFNNVFKLPPAHTLSFDLNSKDLSIKEYWQYDICPDHRPTENEWLEELDSTLRDSVQKHLRSDVEFGAFLSGGVDSSGILAYMSETLESRVNAFSIGFNEESFNELPFAQEAARVCQAKHWQQVVEPDALKLLPELVRHYGEPFADSSAIPTYYVSKLASEHVPMVLSGDGADEIFGGYHSHTNWLKKLTSGSDSLLNMWLTGSLQKMPEKERKAIWHSNLNVNTDLTPHVFQNEFSKVTAYGLGSMVQHLDLKTYLPNDILTKVDVASMMHSLEVRTPFIDLNVVNLAAKIPQKYHLKKDNKGKWHGKLMLKKILEKYFPKDFLNRKKQGFGVPLEIWFSKSKNFKTYVNDHLLSNSPLFECFDEDKLKNYIQKASGTKLWPFLFLDEWMRQNKTVSPQRFSSEKFITTKQNNSSHSATKTDFVYAFIKQRLKFIFQKYDKVALFPAGQHTRWLLREFQREIPMDRLILFDDYPDSEMYPKHCKLYHSKDIPKINFSTCLLSSDIQSTKLTSRAKSLFGSKLNFLYEGLPPGPHITAK